MVRRDRWWRLVKGASMVSLWVQALTGGVLMEMVFIPSGEFLMGSTEKDGKVGQAIGIDELPQHSVNLRGFYIDLHEVTNRQYKAFVDATGRHQPENKYPGIYSWDAGSPPSGKEAIPGTDVSWDAADA